MLADYPVVVDYNFSPIQSPLFHHELLASDDFLTANPCKEVQVFLEDDESSIHDYPVVGLFTEDDEISIQPSESSISLGGVDSSDIHGGDLEVLVDTSIHDGGVDTSAMHGGDLEILVDTSIHDGGVDTSAMHGGDLEVVVDASIHEGGASNSDTEGHGEGSNFHSHNLEVLDASLHEEVISNSSLEHNRRSNFHNSDLEVLGEESSICRGGVEGSLAEDGLFACPESDLLDSNLLATLPDGSLHIAENVSLSLLDSMDEELDLCLGSNVEVAEVTGLRSKVTAHKTTSSSSTSSPRKQRKRKKKTEDKRWNEMDPAEQTDIADHLSTVLRSLLGPRERLEVLAMITGQERSRLSDTDFVIESHMLNESILAKLETFLEKNEIKGEASDSELVVAEPERKRSALSGKKRKCASLPASPQHGGSFVDSAPVLGRKKSHTQKSTRPWRKRTRKEYRQAAKERRSGLFQQEEVISVTQRIEEDEEEEEDEMDIDILD